MWNQFHASFGGKPTPVIGLPDTDYMIHNLFPHGYYTSKDKMPMLAQINSPRSLTCDCEAHRSGGRARAKIRLRLHITRLEIDPHPLTTVEEFRRGRGIRGSTRSLLLPVLLGRIFIAGNVTRPDRGRRRRSKSDPWYMDTMASNVTLGGHRTARPPS